MRRLSSALLISTAFLGLGACSQQATQLNEQNVRHQLDYAMRRMVGPTGVGMPPRVEGPSLSNGEHYSIAFTRGGVHFDVRKSASGGPVTVEIHFDDGDSYALTNSVILRDGKCIEDHVVKCKMLTDQEWSPVFQVAVAFANSIGGHF